MPCIRGCLALLLVTIALSVAACRENGSEEPHTVFPAAAADSVSPVIDTRLSPEEQLGANLPPVNDYSRTHVYVDLVHQARRYGTSTTPWDEKALLDDNGWPVGEFGVLLMTDQKEVQGTEGTYRISFTGRAKVSLVASSGKLHDLAYDPDRNKTTIALDLPVHADQLALAFTHTEGGIRDLQVIRPGYDADAPPLFTREFLAHIARFRTLRFMDWLRTNNNPTVSWNTRTTPEHTHYASARGVPWEHIIELANLAGKDIWINIPVAANDEYVRELATLLKKHLRPESRIYVEYSNEVWNGQFRQHASSFDMAEAEVRSKRNSPLAYDSNRNRNTVGYRFIAERGKQISDLFRQVYGDAPMMKTVRPVFASQVVNPYVTKLGLQYISRVYGPPGHYFYGLAGAPYFNLGADQTAPDLSSKQVLAAMRRSVARLPEDNHLEENVALARWYGLPFLAYEGGSDTFGPGSIEAKKAASLSPEIQQVCHDYLQTWFSRGGNLFMWFDAGAGNWDTPYGTWELTTDLAITDTPKIRCLDQVLTEPPAAPRHRNTVPGRIDALAYAGNFPPYGKPSIDHVRHLPEGEYLDYLLSVPSTGTYTLQLEAAASEPGNTVDIAANGGTTLFSVPLDAQDWNTPMLSAPLPIALQEGFNTLRLTTHSKTSGFDLKALILRRPH